MQTSKRDVFLPKLWHGKHVGYPVEIPRLTLRREFYLRALVEQFAAEVPQARLLFTQDAGVATLGIYAVRGCPDFLVRATAYLLDKEPEWVRNNATLAECLFLLLQAMYLPEDAKPASTKARPGHIKAQPKTWDMARLVDFFGQVYRWTVDDVMSLTRQELDALAEAIRERVKEQEKQSGNKQGRTNTPTKRAPDVRTPDDPDGLNSIMAFANEHGVLKGKE